MFSDGRDPASTCACCGQALPAAGRLTLQVETRVLDACNQAFAEAESQGHAHVDVAHLIAVLTRTDEALVLFWRMNLDPAGMADAASRWLMRVERRRDTAPLTASGELKTLLTRAEGRAIRDGRTHAGLADLISLLADLSASGAHIAEPPTAQAIDASRAPTGHAVPMNGLLTTSPPYATDGNSSRAAPEHERARATADPATLAALIARLERQEAELTALRTAVSAGTSARSRSSQSASTRNRSRGQTYDPGIHVLSTQSTADRIYMRRSLRQRQEQVRRRRNRHSQRNTAAGRDRQSETSAGRSWTDHRSGSWSQNRSNGAAGQPRERGGHRPDFDRESDTVSTDGAKRFFLALDDHIERAPSIGPKTAGRLVDAGIATVRDLLAADPETLAAAVRARFVTAQRVRDWQAQARLVCTVPFLRGTHAQLLVGAGYPTLEQIVTAEPGILCAGILKFATTRDGQSVLRSTPPPDIERIMRWLENAAGAEPARAAA